MKEIDAVDWSKVWDIYGPALDAPQQLRNLMSDKPDDRARGQDWLTGHVIHQLTTTPALEKVAPIVVDMVLQGRVHDPLELMPFFDQAVFRVLRFSWDPEYKLPRGGKANHWGRQVPHGLTGVMRKRQGAMYAAVQPLMPWVVNRAKTAGGSEACDIYGLLAVYGEADALHGLATSADVVAAACGCFGLGFLGDRRLLDHVDHDSELVRVVARISAVRAGLASPAPALAVLDLQPDGYGRLPFSHTIHDDFLSAFQGVTDLEPWLEPLAARGLTLPSSAFTALVKRKIPHIPERLDEHQRRALIRAADAQSTGAAVWLRELGLELGPADLVRLARHRGTVAEAMAEIEADRNAELERVERQAAERLAAQRAERAAEALANADTQLRQLAKLRLQRRYLAAEDAFFDMEHTADHWAALALTYVALDRFDEVFDAVEAGEREDPTHVVLKLARAAAERASGRTETPVPDVSTVDRRYFPDAKSLATRLT